VKWLTAVAIIALCYSPLSTAGDKALLIGINTYLAPVSSLAGTHNDVDSMRKLLTEGFGVAEKDIKVLLDEQATRSNILSAMDDWLIGQSASNDRVFFHFSGHGYYTEDLNGDEGGDGRDEVLVPADALCASGGDCKNLVLDDEIGERMDQLADRFVFTLIDSCHSGTATRSLLEAGSGTTRKLKFHTDADQIQESSYASRGIQLREHKSEGGFVAGGPNHVALFAVSPLQEAPEMHTTRLPNGRNTVGFFTEEVVYSLLEGKADKSRDGSVSFAELHSHLRGAGEEFCKNSASHPSCRAGVTPQLSVPNSLQGTNVLDFGKSSPNASSPLQPTEADNILVNDNNANLRASIRNGGNMRNGDLMRLDITADKSGLLLVLDVNANGELVQLYPGHDGVSHEARPDGKPAGWVRAGYKVVMPDTFSGMSWPVAEPFGDGKLYVVLVEDGEKVETLVNSTRAFGVVANPREHLGTLRQALDELVDVGEIYDRASRWSVVSIDYSVNP